MLGENFGISSILSSKIGAPGRIRTRALFISLDVVNIYQNWRVTIQELQQKLYPYNPSLKNTLPGREERTSREG